MQNTAARKRKQVPEGYLIIGIDPHKKKHAAAAITQDFTVRDRFKFDNTREGLEAMLGRARTEMLKSGCRGVMFAIETGGHYWRNIAYYLDERGIPFRFINQYTLKRRREGKDINRRKNDYRDSEVAAQLLCTGEFVENVITQGVYAELRTSRNAYQWLVKERTGIINLVRELLDALFPEFTQVFKDPDGLMALSVLSTCPIPRVIAGMTEDGFMATIEARHEGRRLMRKKLRALHYSAKTSIGIDAGARSLSSEIAFLVDKLELIRQHICIMEGILIRLVYKTEEGKIPTLDKGCFKLYRSAKQMIKMAGSNPTESELAGKKRLKAPMSKQGRPLLRYCAWTSVIPMLRFNPDFRVWVKQRRERPAYANPLNVREVVGAALNRLLRLAFALVKNQTYYQDVKPTLIPVAV